MADSEKKVLRFIVIDLDLKVTTLKLIIAI